MSILNDICLGYLGIHGQLISQLMYIPYVLNVFDKMLQGKDLVILKEFGYRPFMKPVYSLERSLVKSPRLIPVNVSMRTFEQLCLKSHSFAFVFWLLAKF